MYFATHHFSRQVLNTFRGQTALGYPGLWAGLFISDPTSTGVSGIEIAYAGYQRQPISFTPPAPLTEYGGHIGIMSDADVTWPMSESSPGTALHIGIFDSQLGGNMLLRGNLTVPLAIMPNQQPSVLAGDIVYWGRGDFSLQFREAYLNILRNISLPGFTTHVAAFSGNPDQGGFELSGENYSRPVMTFAAPTINDSGVMSMVNEDVVSFPTPLALWGEYSYRALVRGLTTSQTAAYSARDIPETIHRNYIIRFGAGQVEIRHD